jgi:hypothetical protein
VARTPPSRINRDRILGALRLASRKGDGHALALAIDEMRTLALSPRYWEKYLVLLKNPLARLVDLLVIKQGHRIAHQKGWKLPRLAGAGANDPPLERAGRGSRGRRPKRRAPKPRVSAGAPGSRGGGVQQSLF